VLIDYISPLWRGSRTWISGDGQIIFLRDGRQVQPIYIAALHSPSTLAMQQPVAASTSTLMLCISLAAAWINLAALKLGVGAVGPRPFKSNTAVGGVYF
jgi:hypothetical protein